MLVLFKGWVLFLTYPTKSLNKCSPVGRTKGQEEEDNLTGHYGANGGAP